MNRFFQPAITAVLLSAALVVIAVTLLSGSVAQGGSGLIEVDFNIMTDDYGHEIYWDLVPGGNACGVGTIASGGSSVVGCGGGGAGVGDQTVGYSNNANINEGPWWLTDGAAYTIHSVDDWGDGGLKIDVNIAGSKEYQFNEWGVGTEFNFIAGPGVNFSRYDHLYQSFDELTTWIGEFATANSDIVELVEFGRSHQDRPLFALQFSSEPGIDDPNKPEFLFTAGLHAREVVSSQSTYDLAEYLVDGFRAGDPAVIDVITEREVWIVPNLNPDGRLSVEGGNSWQRKNMELFAGQNSNNYTRGVDLNRNFPHRWEDASDVVADSVYRGPNVLSAPEASSLWAMLEDGNFSDLRAAVDIHSGAETILPSWVSTSDIEENPLSPEEQAVYDFLTDRIAEETGLGTDRLDYDSYGTLADALYENFDAYSFILEIYEGPWVEGEIFRYFNPLNQAGVDESANDVIASAMFLLSDEAFPIFGVPEPSTLTLLALIVCPFAVRRHRSR